MWGKEVNTETLGTSYKKLWLKEEQRNGDNARVE